MTVRMMKAMISHLAMSILNPATPRAPNTYAIIARTKKKIATERRDAMLCFEESHVLNV